MCKDTNFSPIFSNFAATFRIVYEESKNNNPQNNAE